MENKTLAAWGGIVIIGLLPVLLLLLFGPKDYSSMTHTFGQITGLIGMTLFALTFLFSTRARWIEDLFGGLDKVYTVHTMLGSVSFVLLLLHPILLVMKFIPENMRLAAKYLLPGGLISVDFGIFALFGMLILLGITIYGQIKYDKWKMSHKFLGLFFGLAVLHVFLIRDDVARDYIFSGYYIYVTIISIIGLGSFVYKLFLNKLFGVTYKIKNITKLNNCFDIKLEPITKRIYCKPGQFVFVKFHSNKVKGESHPFSVATISEDREIGLIIKKLGDFTQTLESVREGDTVTIEGPYGRFHGNTFNDEIWVAGGIGITPFLGLANAFKKTKNKKVDLYYSVKEEEDFIGLQGLKEIEKSNKNFRLFLWSSQKDGRLTINDIAKTSILSNKEYYFCGPEGLKESLKESLRKKGISSKKIHDEMFTFK